MATSQGQHRKVYSKNPTSTYIGVHWDKYFQKWAATVQKNKKRYPIGKYKTERDAAYAVEKALDENYPCKR